MKQRVLERARSTVDAVLRKHCAHRLNRGVMAAETPPPPPPPPRGRCLDAWAAR